MDFLTQNKTTVEQSYWTQAEKDVLSYFHSKNLEAEMLTEKTWQYKDCDIKVYFNDMWHYVSVKYMPAVERTCNLSFEISLVDRNYRTIDGWFSKGISTLTAIVIPDVEIVTTLEDRVAKRLSNNKRLLLFSSKSLKREVPRLAVGQPKHLTEKQKQLNIQSGRRYIDSLSYIVRLEDILPLAKKDEVIK